jgi:uncharacterized lipoprotein YmbA
MTQRRLALLLTCVVLAACATPPARFYTLAVEPPPDDRPRELTIAVAEVVLPQYLDRPEIVTTEGPTQVRLGDLDRWAESLAPMFQRALGDHLARITGAREVILLPQRRDLPYDVLVDVEVRRFDADEAGRTVLDARWWVYGPGGDDLFITDRVLLEDVGAPPPDYAAIVAAMSRSVGRLAEAAAAGIPGARTAAARPARRPR